MFSLFKNWYQRNFSVPGTVEFALVLIAVFLTVYYLMWLVGPLVVALCLAFCLDWFVRALDRHPPKFFVTREDGRPSHLWHDITSAFVVLSFCMAVIGIALLIVPSIINQGNSLYRNMQAYAQNATMEHHEAVEQGFELTATDLDSTVARRVLKLVESMPDPLPDMITAEFVTDTVRQVRQQVMSYLAQFMKTELMPSVFNVFSGLVYVIIVPLFALLMLVNKYRLQKTARRYLMPHNSDVINTFWPEINKLIEQYVRGKIVHILIMTVINTLAFKFVGLNYSVILGVGAGLSVVIPYVGVVLIGVPAVLVAVIQFGFTGDFAIFLVVFCVVQLLDAYLVTPRLFEKVMKLDTLSILTATLIFGQLWGFWGIFFSIPLATLVRVLLVKWPHQDQQTKAEIPAVPANAPAPAVLKAQDSARDDQPEDASADESR